jgi:hypothetical protein
MYPSTTLFIASVLLLHHASAQPATTETRMSRAEIYEEILGPQDTWPIIKAIDVFQACIAN